MDFSSALFRAATVPIKDFAIRRIHLLRAILTLGNVRIKMGATKTTLQLRCKTVLSDTTTPVAGTDGKIVSGQTRGAAGRTHGKTTP